MTATLATDKPFFTLWDVDAYIRTLPSSFQYGPVRRNKMLWFVWFGMFKDKPAFEATFVRKQFGPVCKELENAGYATDQGNPDNLGEHKTEVHDHVERHVEQSARAQVDESHQNPAWSKGELKTDITDDDTRRAKALLFVALPHTVYNAYNDGEITPSMFDALLWLHRKADWATGKVKKVTAKFMVADHGKRFTERAYQDALKNCHDCGWITSHHVRGEKGWYWVTLHNYVARTGAMIGKVLSPKNVRAYKKGEPIGCDDSNSDDNSDRSSDGATLTDTQRLSEKAEREREKENPAPSRSLKFSEAAGKIRDLVQYGADDLKLSETGAAIVRKEFARLLESCSVDDIKAGLRRAQNKWDDLGEFKQGSTKQAFFIRDGLESWIRGNIAEKDKLRRIESISTQPLAFPAPPVDPDDYDGVAAEDLF